MARTSEPAPVRDALEHLRAENAALREQLAALRDPSPPGRGCDFEICADSKGGSRSEPVIRVGRGWLHASAGGLTFVRLSFERDVSHILTSGRYAFTLWPVSAAPLPHAPAAVTASEVSPQAAAARTGRNAPRPVPMSVLAAQAGVSPSTLRSYVAGGLVPDAGPEGYGPVAQERAALIRTLRSTLPAGSPLIGPLARAVEARGWKRDLPAGS